MQSRADPAVIAALRKRIGAMPAPSPLRAPVRSSEPDSSRMRSEACCSVPPPLAERVEVAIGEALGVVLLDRVRCPEEGVLAAGHADVGAGSPEVRGDGRLQGDHLHLFELLEADNAVGGQHLTRELDALAQRSALAPLARLRPHRRARFTKRLGHFGRARHARLGGGWRGARSRSDSPPVNFPNRVGVSSGGVSAPSQSMASGGDAGVRGTSSRDDRPVPVIGASTAGDCE